MSRAFRDDLEFHGALVVEPPLTAEHAVLLRRLTDVQLRRLRADPSDEEPPPLPPLAGTPPDGVCGWTSCGHGCCLWVDDAGQASVASVTRWLRYLMRHYLAERHTLDGVVVVRDRHTSQTTAIRVRANQVGRVLLCGPDPRYRGHWDGWGGEPSEPGSVVVDLASRRPEG
ncbi:hypothetical protein [Nocardioides nitrophenolicus]|uniref:hypothetical protein n=1 Tax=Nocardioides nitrophenolicus TaxID=60489 RepID=UPI00195B8BDF|nr:hypothetical protein [Nocardioides nitrophenolicus]MBM7515296.1 hypothetical protein [Nocardioides nitrophenolicus]